MRRWFTHCFIGAYLLALAGGIASQTMKFGHFSHPAMYYVIWDMFCGWQAYESRYHIVGEGDSGTLYELAPGPWKRFCPYGDLTRNHYDSFGHAFHKMAMNTLRHTDHEPMRRMFVVEECWPKKLNLPDHLWALRMDEPKDPVSYFWMRAAYSPEGQLLHAAPDYTNWVHAWSVVNNPRLMADAKRGRPFYAVDPHQRQTGSLFTDPTLWAGGENSYRLYGH
jgi:hypothetical protein